MTWREGRQLATVTKGGVTTSYSYDYSGIRRSKTVGTSTVNYTLAGDKVVGMTTTEGGYDYSYSFTFDEGGRPYSVTRTKVANNMPVTYNYIVNLQGDVIKLVDTSGVAVVNYTYDAWGNIVSIKDENGNAVTSMTHIGRTNPFRYRGYIYDEETGFYYCKSRYYDPAIRRWINADCIISTGSGFSGFNLYAYCINNPIIYKDSLGCDAVLIYDFDAAQGFGHAGALIQDGNGIWYFFYWGPAEGENIFSILTSSKIKLELTPLENQDIQVTEGTVSYDNYDAGIYLNGDFSDSFDYFSSEELSNQSYNLFFNNCTQVTHRGLSLSNTSHQEKLKEISKLVVPNQAYAEMKSYSSSLLKPRRNAFGTNKITYMVK